MNAQSNDNRKNIDKFYCINLDKRENRWNWASKQFKKLDINVTRFPAILREDNGHLGCMLSHREILKEALSKGYKKILVFEDDIYISDSLKLTEQIRDFSSMNFDIAYLGCTFVHPRAKITTYNNKYFQAKENIYSTYAIIYDKNIFEYLVKEMDQYENQIKNYGKTFDDIIAKKIQKIFTCILPKKIYIEQTINYSDTEKYIKGGNYRLMNRLGFWTCRFVWIRYLHMAIFWVWSKSVLFFRKKHVSNG